MQGVAVMRWWGYVMVAGVALSCGAEGLRDYEDVESFAESLAKPFGVNGQADFCNDPANPCVSGEGDCDSHAQCSTGYCARDNGPKFGMPIGFDVCVPATCQNKRMDLNETGVDCGGACGQCVTSGCATPDGSRNACTAACLCASGQGDCNSNAECQSGLVCGRDNGSKFGFPAGSDACVAPSCQNRVRDVGETGVDCGGDCGVCTVSGCPVPDGSSYSCTAGCPCATGGGDCNSDADCQAGLSCGRDNGAKFGFPAGSDVCVPAHCTNRVRDTTESAVDCGGDCGTVGCPPTGTSCRANGTYRVPVRGRYQWTEPYPCSSDVSTFTRTIEVTVSESAVVSTGSSSWEPDGFNLSFSVAEDTPQRFRAVSTENCGDTQGPPWSDSRGSDSEVLIDCQAGTVSFSATCWADTSDGCGTITYEESVSGTAPLR